MLPQKDGEAQNLFYLVGISARDAKRFGELHHANKPIYGQLVGSAQFRLHPEA